MLQAIIPSKARREILALFFHNIGESYHLRRVCREVGQEINAVKRELDILEQAHVLKKEKRLNKSIYSLNPAYEFHDEFLRIFSKEAPLGHALMKNKARLGQVVFCAVSLKFIRKVEIKQSEVYLLLVGTIATQEAQKIIDVVAKDFPYEINYTVMTKKEFDFRKKQNDPFIWTFLKEPKVMLLGQESSLMT